MKKQKVSIVSGVIACEYPSIGKTFKGNLKELPASVFIDCDAAQHGMKQKLGDAESGGTPAEKYAEVQVIWESLKAGEWNRTVSIDRTPEILEAVGALTGSKFDREKMTLTNSAGKVAKPSEAEVKTWASNLEVKVKIKEMQLAKARKAAAESKDKLTINFK